MRGKFYDYTFKYIVVGEPAVGKTSMLFRYTEDTFYAEHLATLGVDFKLKTLQVDDKEVKLNIWDTAGQERFSAVVENYYRGAKGALVVFSFGDRHSFDCISKWLERIRPHLIPKVYLVGNKCDLQEGERKVTQSEIRQFIERYNQEYEVPLDYIETSAFTGENVARVFTELTTSLVHEIQELKTLQVDDLTNRQVFTLDGVDPYAKEEEKVAEKKCC